MVPETTEVTFCVRAAISPLLANVYLHDFDRAFHAKDGPAQFANARLVRYADDFVVLARWMGPRVVAWLERTLEQDLGLTVNRTKTRVVTRRAPRASLDFLGFTLRYDRDLHGRDQRYLHVVPSARAQARLRATMRADLGAGRDVAVRHDCRGQYAVAWLVDVLPVRIPAHGLPPHQPLPAGTLPLLSAESESTTQSSVSCGRDAVCGAASRWPPLAVTRVVRFVCRPWRRRVSVSRMLENLHVRFDEGERLSAAPYSTVIPLSSCPLCSLHSRFSSRRSRPLD